MRLFQEVVNANYYWKSVKGKTQRERNWKIGLLHDPQKADVGVKFSAIWDMTCVVPQRSILSLMLFNFYVKRWEKSWFWNRMSSICWGHPALHSFMQIICSEPVPWTEPKNELAASSNYSKTWVIWAHSPTPLKHQTAEFCTSQSFWIISQGSSMKVHYSQCSQ